MWFSLNWCIDTSPTLKYGYDTLTSAGDELSGDPECKFRVTKCLRDIFRGGRISTGLFERELKYLGDQLLYQMMKDQISGDQ